MKIRWVLSLVGKDEKVDELQIWQGKQFQTVGAEIEKTPVSTGDIIHCVSKKVHPSAFRSK